MADFRPPSTAVSEPIKSDKNPKKRQTNVLVSHHRQGRLWRKIGLIGSVAVMGGQPVLAQMDFTGGDAIALPVTEEVAPEVVAAPATSLVVTPPVVEPVSIAVASSVVVEPVPVVAAPSVAAEPTPVIPAAPPVVVEPAPILAEPVVTTPVVVPPAAVAPEPQAPSFSDSTAPPAVDVVTPNDVVPSAIPTAEDLAADYGGVFVDPTDYSVGATTNPNAPEVFVSDRATGCEYNASNIGGCGVAGQSPTVAVRAPGASVAATGSPGRSITIGPVSISRSGVRFSGGLTTAAGREYYNTVAKPLVALQVGESFVFPLASPSPITSLFGWRWHPIHQDYRFHGGTDLGAPQGTPILATQSGQVSVADYLGGYGLTVILRHGDNSLESRYAHMSHILVQPGEHVEQGDVIGLVGSTGNSTGPHLHFELHQLTSQGWVAISPNEVLSYALERIDDRLASNPLQLLSIAPKAQAAPAAKAALPKSIKTETLVSEAPHFRPAQPNAQ